MLRSSLTLTVAAAGLIVGAMFLVNDPVQESPSARAEATESLSGTDRSLATAVARNRAAVDDLLARSASVADLPRGEVENLYVADFLSFGEAREVADEIVLGEVIDQFIEVGPYPDPRLDGEFSFLISLVRTDHGSEVVRVSQTAPVLSDDYGLRLIHGLGSPLLDVGKEYLLLTTKIDKPDSFLIMRGHSYEVTDGRLQPLVRHDGNLSVVGARVESVFP